MRAERISSDVIEADLGRPEKLNAMDRAQWENLRAIIESADSDSRVRAVVLRGDQRAFCAGNDIRAMAEADANGTALDYFVNGMLPAFAAMARSSVPIISLVEGQTLGGGVELVCFSDLVVAGPHATFSLPETRIGVFATIYLGACAQVSSRRAGARLALTGHSVDAAEAHRLGLVTHLATSSAEVPQTVAEILDDIRATSRDATMRTKSWLNKDLIEVGLDRCRDALVELCTYGMEAPEYRRAIDAFWERQAVKAARTILTTPAPENEGDRRA